jgi:hypothetical protein
MQKQLEPLNQMKTCIKCGQVKHLDEFCKGKNICKNCRKQYAKAYFQTHKEEAREYRRNHREQEAKRKKKYYLDHKEYITKQLKEYRQTHKKEAAEYRRDHRGEAKEYAKKYYLVHREQEIKRVKKYYLVHREQEIKRMKQYYQDHKEEINERAKQYNQDHKEELQQWRKDHYQARREEELERVKEYNQTTEGKATKLKCYAKRCRDLGFNSLNESFPGSVWHHINNEDVVAIQEEVHLKFIGISREKHRRLVLEYYGSLENMINFQSQITK